MGNLALRQRIEERESYIYVCLCVKRLRFNGSYSVLLLYILWTQHMDNGKSVSSKLPMNMDRKKKK